MKTIDALVQVLSELPEELREEVWRYTGYLKDSRMPKPGGKMKLDWRGLLRDMREEYTSVQLQHKLTEWR
jgi:hypothetical protein